MTRVSENSSYHAINYSTGKGKEKLEDLQIKGANLKRIQKPSDDPIGNIELLSVRSKDIDNEQYLRNANYAKTQLSYTEAALDEVYNALVKAKEIAIGQSSNIYSDDVRKSIAKEVHQLRNQTLSVANRRLGNKYLFAGFKTLSRPFDAEGRYHGDGGQITLEVQKDIFVPVNFDGRRMFFTSTSTSDLVVDPLGDARLKEERRLEPIKDPLETPEFVPKDEQIQEEIQINRELASVNQKQSDKDELNLPSTGSIFSDLKTLETALITNNSEVVQSLLPKLDDHIARNVESRAKIGSIINSIESSEENLEETKILNAEYKTKIEDVDVAELFSNLAKQQNVMKATYKANANLISTKLLDFI
jgi:flagellar hook-associated protein 3 FlgL